jgi:hypothetical protein
VSHRVYPSLLICYEFEGPIRCVCKADVVIYKSIAARPPATIAPKPGPRLLAALLVTTAGTDVSVEAGTVGVTNGIVVAVAPKVIGVVGAGAATVPVEVLMTGIVM